MALSVTWVEYGTLEGMASEDTTPNSARREITVRRAPKFVPFMILGAVVGAIVAGQLREIALLRLSGLISEGVNA